MASSGEFIHKASLDESSTIQPIHHVDHTNRLNLEHVIQTSIHTISPPSIVTQSKHTNCMQLPFTPPTTPGATGARSNTLASPIHLIDGPFRNLHLRMEADQEHLGCDGGSVDVDMPDLESLGESIGEPEHLSTQNHMPTSIRTEWIGTSQFCIDHNIDLQQKGQLDILIKYRSALIHDLKVTPYDPALYIDLSRVDTKLGFCDIALANAFRGLILVKAGLTPSNRFSSAVRNVIFRKIQVLSPIIIDDELTDIHLKLSREYINGFLGTSCYWDGLVKVKEALHSFPGDAELLEMRHVLKESFEDRYLALKDSDGEPNELKAISRMGKIYQKAYPWLDGNLNLRTPELLKYVNKTLGTEYCEVRKVLFGPPVFGPEPPAGFSIRRQGQEKNVGVGPLGIFATRDIEEHEIIMADKTLTAVSQIPSSRKEHCDACHASLSMPFVHPKNVVNPYCCGKVAYCSQKCYKTAMKEYHQVICGKEISWLYEDIGTGRRGCTRWRPIMFLRLIAIVIQDRRNAEAQNLKPVHPLQHHLVARMAANYAPADKYHPDYCNDWQFFENVTAPTRILLDLGIDIFTNLDFTPEVVQTIYWRMENNANLAAFNLSPRESAVDKWRLKSRKMPHLTVEEEEDLNDGGAINMTCLNNNYLFFNHSCEPNVSWRGSIPDPSVSISWLRGVNNEIHKPGESTVFCKAARNIKKGEELKISYIGDPMGRGEAAARSHQEKGNGMRKVMDEDEHEDNDSEIESEEESDVSPLEKERRKARVKKRRWLEKWFAGGCGCRVCEEENHLLEVKKRKAASKKNKAGEKEYETLSNMYCAV